MENLIKKIRKEKLGKLLQDVSLKMFNTYKLNPKAKVVENVIELKPAPKAKN